jgi:hypothetical protein
LAVRSGSGWDMHDRMSSIVNSLAEAIERWPNLVIVFFPARFLPNPPSVLITEDRRLWISNLACCFRPYRRDSRLPSLWRYPARLRCGSYERAFLRIGIHLYSSRARTPT